MPILLRSLCAALALSVGLGAATAGAQGAPPAPRSSDPSGFGIRTDATGASLGVVSQFQRFGAPAPAAGGASSAQAPVAAGGGSPAQAAPRPNAAPSAAIAGETDLTGAGSGVSSSAVGRNSASCASIASISGARCK